MGYGDPQAYNPRSRIPTPAIDALAAKGMRFTDAHTASSVCTPSRYGLLTGRYPWRSRLPVGITQSWGLPVIAADRLDSGQAPATAGLSHGSHRQVASRLGLAAGQRRIRLRRIADRQPGGRRPRAPGPAGRFLAADPQRPHRTRLRLLLRRRRAQFPALPVHRERPRPGHPRRTHAAPQKPARRPHAAQLGPVGRATDDRRPRRRVGCASRRGPTDRFFCMSLCSARIRRSCRPRSSAGAAKPARTAIGRCRWTPSSGASSPCSSRAGKIDNTFVLFTSDNGSPARSGIGTVSGTHTVDRALCARPQRPLARAQGRRLGSGAPRALHRPLGQPRRSRLDQRCGDLPDRRLRLDCRNRRRRAAPRGRRRQLQPAAPAAARQAGSLPAERSRSQQLERNLRHPQSRVQADLQRRQRRVFESAGQAHRSRRRRPAATLSLERRPPRAAQSRRQPA